MSLLQENIAVTQCEALREENKALRKQLAQLSETSINISGNINSEGSLQEVIEGACEVTGARYGALIVFQPAGRISDYYTCGLSPEEHESMKESPQGMGLLGYISSCQGPVRVKDISTHPEFLGPSGNNPRMKTFLGMPMYHHDEHVGNLYLTEKAGGQEFTEEDEFSVSILAAQAASKISHAAKREAERRSKVELETLMDLSPVAISVFDVRAGEIIYVNQEARRIIGALDIREDDLENVFETLRFTRTDGREIPFAELAGTRALLTGETVRADEVVTHLPNGDSITTLVNCAPLFSDTGEMLSVMSVMQDITPLQEIERQKGEFLGKVSEELRTPLTTIKGSTIALRALNESQNANESVQLLRIIDQQADLMRSQLNTLIELTQIESGTLSVAIEATNLGALIERSCRDYLREHASIAIQLDVPKGLPKVTADKHRIGQVLHNCIRQAAKHSNESSPVRVSVSEVDIYVSVSVSVAGSLVATEKPLSFPVSSEVSQTLKGLSKAHNGKAAELSSQGEGLALAFCRGVIEAHGGRMMTELNEQDGSLSLTFTLQSVEEEDEVLDPPMPEFLGEPLPAPVEKTQILVSIENAKLLNLVRRVLDSAGYSAAVATSVDEIEQVAFSESPKLIIVDIVGREEECFRTLRRARSSQQLPAIVLCDRDDEEYVVRAFDMGADGYMVKPFSPTELIARIKATLRRSVAGSDASGKNTFQSGHLRIDFQGRIVTVAGEPVQLTATEYKLLSELSTSAGWVLTQDTLLERVWGTAYSGESQLLRSYIKSLRQKLGDKARNPSYIFTEHGVGYRMAKALPATNHVDVASSEPEGVGAGDMEKRTATLRNGARFKQLVG